MPPKSISWDAATRLRLQKQFLSKPAKSNQIAEAVSAVCGLQAQVLSAAELGICVRVNSVSRPDVHAAIWKNRTIVKTYGPRTTLHLLPSSELPMWMAAMRAREAQQDPDHPVGGGFTARQAHSLVAAISQALNGCMLSREQLAREVGRKEGKWAQDGLKHGWGVLLGPAAYSGFLCFGPSEGAKVNYVRADQWVKDWKWVDEKEALREVARRYVVTYGPVRVQDFSRWFWITRETAQKIFDEISDSLEHVEFERKSYWIRKGARMPSRPAGDQVFLLPQYDCYTIGCVPRSRLILDAGRGRILSHGRGRFESATGLPVLIIDGIVSGIWERKQTGKKLIVKVEPFVKLKALQKEKIETRATRFADFLGLYLELAFSKLS